MLAFWLTAKEDVGEATISDEVEERIENLKQEKAKQKF